MSTELVPPGSLETVSSGEKHGILGETRERMSDFIPALAYEDIDKEHAQIEGGYIFAWGKTDINDLHSELHHRSDIGVRSYDRYHSIDTGKYCMAPLYALEVVRRVHGSYPRKYPETEGLLRWIR